MEKSYQVIARRWRPKQFDELVGQDHIVRTLRNAIDTKRIAHAYLFVGPRGTGKTSTARLFAKALNAEGGPSATPDNDSEISQAIMGGSCMDVIEIDGASNNGVEQVRALRDDCQYAPTQCTYKIYIIDEVHMLSTAAFNALLKTLEEPPEHVKFFFATTEAHKVLPTITSRCQRFEFRPISDKVITEKLMEISDAEGIKVEHAALTSIARLANGGMRDAQSILDQMISFCGSQIEESDVLDVYGLVSGARIAELGKALGTLDYPAIIAAVDQFADEGRDLFRILQDLEAYAREALLDAIQNGGSTAKLGVPLTTESIMRMLDALHRGEASVQRGLSEKVNFEVVLLKAAEESRSRAIDSLIKQLAGAGATLPDEKKKALVPATPEAIDVQTTEVVEAPSTPALDAPDNVIDALLDVELPEVDAERARQDAEADRLAQEAAGVFSTGKEKPVVVHSGEPLMSPAQAAQRLGPKVLAVLEEKFNGSLTDIRYPDENDLLF